MKRWTQLAVMAVMFVACMLAAQGAFAQGGARAHTVAMATTGSLYHVGGRTENVAHVPHAGLLGIRGRLEARSLWVDSQGHRANLPLLRVALVRDGNGGAYVTGRKLFRR